MLALEISSAERDNVVQSLVTAHKFLTLSGTAGSGTASFGWHPHIRQIPDLIESLRGLRSTERCPSPTGLSGSTEPWEGEEDCVFTESEETPNTVSTEESESKRLKFYKLSRFDSLSSDPWDSSKKPAPKDSEKGLEDLQDRPEDSKRCNGLGNR